MKRVQRSKHRFVHQRQESPSVDQFYALIHAPERKLDTLGGEFDALLASMQDSQARARMNAAFHATPKQLGKAALAAARKRG
jgi:antitoxin Phd